MSRHFLHLGVAGPPIVLQTRWPDQPGQPRFTFEIRVGTPNSRWQTSAKVAIPLRISSWLGLAKTFKGDKTEQAAEVGKALAAAAKQAGVDACVFDRAGYLYHGRVKALADGARAGGLEF